MQRLFLDTNVMLDLLGERRPYYNSIAHIASLADKGKVQIVVSSLSYATTFYILSKYERTDSVKNKLRKFKILSEVSSLNETVVEKALNSDFKDFEDALQYHCAVNSNCNYIITRNGKDFKNSNIPIMTSEEYLISIGA